MDADAAAGAVREGANERGERRRKRRVEAVRHRERTVGVFMMTSD